MKVRELEKCNILNNLFYILVLSNHLSSSDRWFFDYNFDYKGGMTDGSKLQYYRFYNLGGIYEAIVIPEYQGNGLGRVIMEQVMDFIHEQLKPGYKFMVSLCSAKGKDEFYKKFGFVSRPNDAFGPGMHQWFVNE